MLLFVTKIHICMVALKKSVKRNMAKVYNTQASKGIAQPSTVWARHCFTSEIGRGLVLSVWYGRKPKAFHLFRPYSTVSTCQKHAKHFEIHLKNAHKNRNFQFWNFENLYLPHFPSDFVLFGLIMLPATSSQACT